MAALGLALVALLGAGCTATQPDEDPNAPVTPAESVGPELTGDLTIYAAASLKTAFDELAAQFEARHPSLFVQPIVYDGSSTLATQLIEGAPADVFASANRSNMDGVVKAGEVSGEPRVFARNRLQIAVPAGNPARVRDLHDFGDDAPRLGLCARGVPCGDFARAALARAGVTPSLDTNEPDVRALLTKIELGELDGGITYLTDVASAGGRVQGIDIPDDRNVVAEYPIAVLARAPVLRNHPDRLEAAQDYLRGRGGRAVVMGRFTAGRTMRWLGWATAAIMAAASIGTFAGLA